MNKKSDTDGVLFELYASQFFHQEGTPLLISPLLLRKRDLGQVDLGVINKKGVIVAECKSGQGFIHPNQRARLVGSAKLISFLFNKSVKLQLLYGFAKSFESAYSFKSRNIGELR